MKTARAICFLASVAVLLLLPAVGALADVEFALTIENNTELNLSIKLVRDDSLLGQNLLPLIQEGAFEVKPMSIVRQQFRVAAGLKLIVFEPSGCGDPRQFPVLQKAISVPTANQPARYFVLQDSDFGKSAIALQCPERMGGSERCIRARAEVTRLEALREDAQFLEDAGWGLAGRITMPDTGDLMYYKLKRLERERDERLSANPMAASTDPVYRRLAQEHARLHDVYTSQMTALIRRDAELYRRNVGDYATLVTRKNDAFEKWQAEKDRYDPARAERDRLCAGQ